MPLTKAKGNMYSWLDYTHSHLAGECPHRCRYCYVQAMERRFKMNRYTGPVRLIEDEFNVKYPPHKRVFVEHMNDLFAERVEGEFIRRILEHCRAFPETHFFFQTKNPGRVAQWVTLMPPMWTLGTTIETNRDYCFMQYAPSPDVRRTGLLRALRTAKLKGVPPMSYFVTIEPIMDFNLREFLKIIEQINPTFINIGADSKKSHLPEPTRDKLVPFLEGLGKLNMAVIVKSNLERLLK